MYETFERAVFIFYETTTLTNIKISPILLGTKPVSLLEQLQSFFSFNFISIFEDLYLKNQLLSFSISSSNLENQ